MCLYVQTNAEKKYSMLVHGDYIYSIIIAFNNAKLAKRQLL